MIQQTQVDPELGTGLGQHHAELAAAWTIPTRVTAVGIGMRQDVLGLDLAELQELLAGVFVAEGDDLGREQRGVHGAADADRQ